MALLNDGRTYGALTKLFHWLIVALFAFQYVAAAIMLNLAEGQTALGLTASNYFNWHKSIGLIALLVAILRLLNRKAGSLPDWAPTLSRREHKLIHIYENALYAAMLVMPLSGFVYVMAGGYGVHFMEMTHLPNPIGENETLAGIARWCHIVCGWVILAALVAHIGLVLRHQLILKDGLLRRMLP